MNSEKPRGFPPGARVLADGRDEVRVRQFFPDGLSSYMFPHYKVDYIGGDKNVAISVSRIGVDRKGRAALAEHDKKGQG